jgi:hypothetical protein
MSIMLNEQSIERCLKDLISALRRGELAQAEVELRVLHFERLLRPVRSLSKGPIQFVDPGAQFGAERVHQTGDQIYRCIAAIQAENVQEALGAAEAALARWNGDR